jgi:nicotinate phosphoribosyltransferase
MIIQSLLDTDLYKFTMMQVVLHHFPAAQAEYRFKCRNAEIDLTPYVDEIRDEIRALCTLRFRPDELDYLRRWRFVKSDYVDLLKLFQLDERFIEVGRLEGSATEIDIRIRGPWLHTILFEVPVLARSTTATATRGTTSPRGGAGSRPRSRRSTACTTPTSGSPTTAPAAAFPARGRRRSCRRCTGESGRSSSAPATSTSRTVTA